MWAWILIDEPSPVAEDTVHTALEMALRRDHRSLVIVPSIEPGKALVLGIGGAAQNTFFRFEHRSPDIAEVPESVSAGSVGSPEIPTTIDDEPVAPDPDEPGPLQEAPGIDEFMEAEAQPVEDAPSAIPAEELPTAIADEASTSPEPAGTKDEVMSNPPEQASPKYVATGFLGLVDEPILEDEPAPSKKWWQKLFG